MIVDLHRQGFSISAIARQLRLDRKTVRRAIAQGLEPPVYGPRQPRVSQLQHPRRGPSKQLRPNSGTRIVP